MPDEHTNTDQPTDRHTEPEQPTPTLTRTETILGETVVTTVEFDSFDVTVHIDVQSLGATWTTNTRKAISLGVATIWETSINDIRWSLWTPRRPNHTGPWQWFIARDIYHDGELLDGEWYAHAAMIHATRHIQTRNQTTAAIS